MNQLSHRSAWALLPSSLIAVTIACTPPALAQTKANTEAGKNGSNWIVNCGNQSGQATRFCTMSQTILETHSRKRIVSATIVKDSGAWAMGLLLPHGLDLTSGVAVSIDDGTATRYPFRTADKHGAYVRVALPTRMIAEMKSGQVMRIGVVSVGNQSAKMELSLSGFSGSLALMDR
ncbi:invasion associated locus B family protein [uncultured Roseibium sp.]|uniref:invasion associated locus B family protein n=1 Tax=uncultured Roseibium sp. TaxID=1936171 RepID=UPI0026056F8E|nr:invasion associated locus B family protein [uncultured Roseibium sp.]